MAATFQPRRLQRAREEGSLNARCRFHAELLRSHGLWCWRMSVPMVWFERRSPSSRLSRVHLDMLTTPYRLTASGQAALIAISARQLPPQYAVITADGGMWDRVPPAIAADFARAVFRAIRRPDHYQFLSASVRMTTASARPENVLPFAPRAVSA